MNLEPARGREGYLRTSANPVPYITYLISMNESPEREVETPWLKERQRRHASRYLKGPVPLVSLQAAARLPGKALALYLAIRHRFDLRRTPEVTLPADYLAAWGINKDAKRRSLATLEAAGLIRVVGRGPGRSIRVARIEPEA